MSYWQRVLSVAWLDTRAITHAKNRGEAVAGVLSALVIAGILYLSDGLGPALDFGRLVLVGMIGFVATFAAVFTYHLLAVPPRLDRELEAARDSAIAEQRSHELLSRLAPESGEMSFSIPEPADGSCVLTPTIFFENVSQVPIRFEMEDMTATCQGIPVSGPLPPWLNLAVVVPPGRRRSFSYHHLNTPLASVVVVDLTYRLAYGAVGQPTAVSQSGTVRLTSRERLGEPNVRETTMTFVGEIEDHPIV